MLGFSVFVWPFVCIAMAIFCVVHNVAWAAAIWGFNFGFSLQTLISWIESRRH